MILLKSSIIFLFILIITFNIKASEICEVSNKMPGTIYKNKDLSKSQKLCSLDFYSSDYRYFKKNKLYQVGLCPKTVNTNPGTEIYLIPSEFSKDEFQQYSCMNHYNDIPGSKLAKFKSGTSCSYSQSILAYYHFSRYFNVGDVPVSVYRTMDRSEHFKIVKKALDIPHLDGIIKKTWKHFAYLHHKGLEARRSERVFTSDGKYIYGALSLNPKKEKKYFAINGIPSSYDEKFDAFLATNTYQDLITPNYISTLSIANKEHFQKVLAIDELSTMLVLDYILSQKDRVGNIHYKLKYAYLSKHNKLTFKSYDKDDSKKHQEMSGLGAIIVKKLLLKDNDCGIVKSNRTRQYKMIEPIKQISHKTYYKVLKLQSLYKTNEMKKFLINELKFTNNDYILISKNIDRLTSMLKSKCISGDMKLNADAETFLKGETKQYGCSL